MNEFGTTPPEEEKDEKILPKEIREGLNEIRKSNIPFDKKADELAKLMREKGCKDVVVIDCDVCVTDFFPEFNEMIAKVFPDNFNELSPEEQEKIRQEAESLIPKEAKARVQGKTPVGNFTYCFCCESTMCMNEVEYPEDAKWTDIHKEKAKEILLNHSEWQIDKFYIVAATRNRISIDVISSDPELTSQQFDVDGLHIDIDPADEEILDFNPKRKAEFKSLVEETEEEINAGLGIFLKRKILYHGSGTTGIEKFDKAEEDTVGSGVYFTSEAKDAASYARVRVGNNKTKRPVVYEVQVENIKLLNMKNAENIKSVLEGFVPVLLELKAKIKTSSPIIKETITDMIDEKIRLIKEGKINIHNIRAGTKGVGDAFSKYVNSLGYDGLVTYEGGEGSDFDEHDHDTYLIFDPEKIKIKQEQAL